MSAIFDENQQHIDPITGTLLVGGKLYIGDPGVDPVINPKDVFDNREFTGSALGQPLTIGIDGRVANKAWVSGKYSYRIDSSADVLKYQELQNGFDEAVGNIQTGTSLGVNDITAVGSPTQTAYRDNVTYIVTAPADNTGAMTVNIDSIGVVAIRKAHDQAVVSGDVKADMKLQLIYNSTDGWMELQGAVLGSVFGGGIDVTGGIHVTGGIALTGDLVLTESSDHTATPTAGKGQLWSKNDAPNTLYYTDDAGTDFPVSPPPIIAGHIRAGNTQIWDGESTVAVFDFNTELTVATWESIGPTGSGADNIWALMDQIPANARILLCDVYLAAIDDGGADAFSKIYVSHGNDATPAIGTGTQVATLNIGGATATSGIIYKRIMIPLGATNRDFHAYWAVDGSTANPQMYYRGFITD